MTERLARRNRRPTQADVANLAGVSQSIVSRVLNGDYGRVPLRTRRRIQDAIGQLGYVPHTGARALRAQSTMTLALVIPDIANQFYPAVERGIQETAEASGYQLITYNTDGVLEKERAALQSILEGRADGAIIHDFHLTPTDFEPLLRVGIAIAMEVSLPERLAGLRIDRVVVPMDKAIQEMTGYLLERDYWPLATITGSLDTSIGRERLASFLTAVEARGRTMDPAHVVEGDFTYEAGQDAMRRLLVGQVRPRGVFAANDLMALGALEVLREAGLRVPEEVAIAGFDDIAASRMVTPRLTTVSQPQREIGRQLASLLVQRLQGDPDAPVREVTGSLQLVFRESA